MMPPMEPEVTYLLDTHVWIWFFKREVRAGKLLTSLPVDARIGISVMTIWEAAMLEAKGRVAFAPNLATLIRQMLADDLCALVPLLPEIAIASTRLENFHNDPSDRIIVSTARHVGATLVTADSKIINWASVPGRLPILTL